VTIVNMLRIRLETARPITIRENYTAGRAGDSLGAGESSCVEVGRADSEQPSAEHSRGCDAIY
jgi:hypothetical protein